MKPKLKILKFLSIVFSILLTITLFNCNNDYCNDPNGYNVYYPLSNTDDTLLIPYTGNETLKFLKMTPSDTDTVVYQGMGKEYYVNEVFKNDLECPETHYYEAYKIRFRNHETIGDFYDIVFKLEMASWASSEYYVNFLERSFSHNTEFTLNSTWYGGYLGNVTFENQSFSRVSYLQREYNDIPERLYINAYNGIIRFELNEFVLQLIK